MLLIEISGKGVEPSCPLSAYVCMCVSCWIWGTLQSGISELKKPNKSKQKDLWLFWSNICYGKCNIKSNNLPKIWVSKGILHSHDNTEFRTGLFHWKAHGTTGISHAHTHFPGCSWLAISNGKPQVSFKIHQCITERHGGARQTPLFPQNKGTLMWPTGSFACCPRVVCLGSVLLSATNAGPRRGAKLAFFYLFTCLQCENNDMHISGKEDILLCVVHQNFHYTSTKYFVIGHISQFMNLCSIQVTQTLGLPTPSVKGSKKS